MLLHQYAGAGNEDRLYEIGSDVLEVSGYDLDLAGPRLLGRDTARIIGTKTRGRSGRPGT